MKKTLHTVFVIIITIGAILCIFVLIYKGGKSNASSLKTYEVNWKVNIPNSYKEVYHISGPRGFQGDGKRYTLFEAKEINSSLIGNAGNGEIESRIGNSKDNLNSYPRQFVEKTVKDLKVPKEYIPNFDKFYMWKEFTKNKNEKLVIIYLPDLSMVCFAELLM